MGHKKLIEDESNATLQYVLDNNECELIQTICNTFLPITPRLLLERNDLRVCNDNDVQLVEMKEFVKELRTEAIPSTTSTSVTESEHVDETTKSRKRRDSGTSSEEERLLTAIEAGKLEEVDDVELKKIKDPKLMTARQRSIYDRNNDKKENPQTAEEIQKAQLKSQKRKHLADEKREKDKKKTMERLLKKQESKQKTSNKPKSAKSNQPMLRCRNTL
uniref:INO80 complex subunit B-like conserved region domain-containing protein n=1 Tax=Glossina austeni TaxID=7395 RepID=A0A1A9VB59_GLOAU